MNVLVTGGAGYIGSVLCRMLLEQGHTVRVIDRLMHGDHGIAALSDHPKFALHCADIRDRKALAAATRGMDAVVHLAAIVGDPACAAEPETAEQTNEHATMQLLRQADLAGVQRFVFASTCSNYGKMPEPDAMVHENSPLNPVSLYARTKVNVEKTLLNPQRLWPFTATALRFATVYGCSPRMRFDLTVNEFLMTLMTRSELTVFGEQFWRPYVHVTDLAASVVHVLNQPHDKVHQQVFNVGRTDQNFTKGQLIEMMTHHFPQANIRRIVKVEDPRDYRVDFTKIETELGYRAQWTVEQGIEEIINWLRSHPQSETDYHNPMFRNTAA